MSYNPTYADIIREELECGLTPKDNGSIQDALVKALREIARLTRQVEELSASQAQTANIASCLANGIRPD